MSEAPLALARHYLSIEQPQKALDALKDVQELAVDDAEYWVVRASALTDLERHADAAEAAARGLAVSPEDIPLLRLRAESLGELGRLGEAEAAILKALNLAAESPDLLCAYAKLLAHGDQLEKASRLVEWAARLAPDDSGVRSAQILLAHVKGEDSAAISHAQSLLADAPDDPNRHYLMGFSLDAKGRTGSARKHYLAAAELDPGLSHVVQAAREARVASDPALAPLRLIHRIGPAGVWLGAVLTSMALAAGGAYRTLVVFAVLYLLLCVYSWVAPPAVRWWHRRQR